MVSLMDFSYHEDSDQVLFRGRFRWDDSREAITDRVQLVFLELPNCRKGVVMVVYPVDVTPLFSCP